MSRLPVPLRDASQRMPEQGRIRMGVEAPTRNGKKAPKSIDTWRLTSQDRQAIEKAAELYGGDARPWEGAPVQGEWEVITTTDRLPIVLPPDPLGGTPVYELWSKGGLQRRCDGVTCLTPVSTPDGWENAEVACKCVAAGAMSCDPHTRLSVILPELPFAGVWRLDTKGWNAFRELPGMVEALQHLLGSGRLTRAFLVNEGEEVVRPKPNKPGEVQTQVYRVPRLRWPASFDEVLAGASDVAALARVPSSAGALPPAPAATDDLTDGERAAYYAHTGRLPDDTPSDDPTLSTAQMKDAVLKLEDGDIEQAKVTWHLIETGELRFVGVDENGAAIVATVTS